MNLPPRTSKLHSRALYISVRKLFIFMIGQNLKLNKKVPTSMGPETLPETKAL